MNRLCIFIVLITALSVVGCHKGPDVSKVEVNYQLVPFYLDINSIAPEKAAEAVPSLKQKYGDYLEGYSMRVIKIGSTRSPQYAEYLRSFLEYQPNRDVFEKCKVRFANLKPLKSQLDDAFKHYHHYFPQKAIPDVYLQISGFNQSIVVDSAVVGVSIEKYLGATCEFYQWLDYPVYLRRKMIPEKIVPDIMKAMALTEFAFNDSIDDIASNIIFQGKALHFVKAMMPELPDTLLFDFTERELKWSKQYEDDVWASTVEHKYLFNNDRLMIQKMVGDAPFTSLYGQDSPGHLGLFVGYQIVDAYLKAHPEVTLQQLMTMRDYRKILAGSGYRP
jgi:hypothetical protein